MRKIIYWLPSIFFMTLIFLGSGDQASGGRTLILAKWLLSFFFAEEAEPQILTSLIFIIRKTAHISEYFILSLANYYAFSRTFNRYSFQKTIFSSSSFSLLYALSDEFHQTFVNNRVGSFDDVMIDTIGILFAYLVITMILKIRTKINLA